MRNIASEECNPSLAQAIDSVGQVFNEDQCYNIGSKKKSPFTLIRQLVDEPYKLLTLKYADHPLFPIFGEFVPSHMGNVPRTEGSYYHSKAHSLEVYDNLLRQYCHKDLPENIYHAFDSLRYLISEITLRGAKRFNSVPETYCRLCWRMTQQYRRNELGRIQPKQSLRLSGKYCDEHTLGDREKVEGRPMRSTQKPSDKTIPKSKNWSNYVRGQRYEIEFAKESRLAELSSTRHKSKFASIIEWVIQHNDFIRPNCHEMRKLVHNLVTSRINNSRRLAILELYLAGLNVSVMSNHLDIPKSSVYRDIEILKEDIPKIVRKIYISPLSGEEVNIEVMKFDNLLELFKHGAIKQISPSIVQEIYHRVPPLSLERIRNELLEGVDRKLVNYPTLRARPTVFTR